MEQKKKLPAFDIVNIVVMSFGVVLTIIDSIILLSSGKKAVMETDNIVFFILGNISMVAAYAASVFYMLSGYGKKASKLYKVFMYAFVIKTLIWTLISMRNGSGGYLRSILILAVLLESMVLARAKDFGKRNTFIITGLLLVAQSIDLVLVISRGAPALHGILNIILTIEACIMVLAKYRDKDARGSK